MWVMSKVKALFHIVFSTKYRRMTIVNKYREDLYKIIWNDIVSHRCRLLRIGGVPDHIHMLVDLNPSISLSDFMRDIKADSSKWLRRDGRFPGFEGWAREYYAVSVSPDGADVVIGYIRGQQEHHGFYGLNDELITMCRYSDLEYHEKDLME